MNLQMYGSKSCSRCVVTKNQLQAKGIEFTYSHLEDCHKDLRDRIVEVANAEGLKQLPLLILDDKPTTLQEVLKKCR